MPLNFTGAHSSRVRKSQPKKNLFDRSAASSFARLARQQSGPGPSKPPVPKSKKDDDDDDEFFSERLEDHGLITTLETDLTLRDVVPTMQYVQSTMFDEVPLEKSGLSSTQISTILNFRRALPPLVTNAHIHAVVQSPTSVEREIAALAREGLVRRVRVPGRGTGGAAIGDGLALTADWAAMVQRHEALDEKLKEKYVSFLHSGEPDAGKLSSSLSDAELTALMRAGFVTASSAALRAATNVFAARHSLAASRTSFDSVSRAASGSADAVGGASATLDAGGGGGSSAGRSTGSSNSSASYDVRLTLPSTGAYLKMVHGARNAVLGMLKRTKHGEAPLYLLKERWDGTVGTKAYGRSRYPFAQVLPAKIRKWKEFSGVRFDWVLAECLGAGLVEVFETGSVGWGVRVLVR